MAIQKAKTLEEYKKNYLYSIEQPDLFWAEEAQRLYWFSPFSNVRQVDYAPDSHKISWFQGGTLNVSYNCLDRHLPTRADKPAIIWEGDTPSESRVITYRALYEDVCRFANVLKSRGVEKGDRIILYLPMIPEAAVAMLACSRLGAIHSVVFGGFSSDSLASRIEDCEPKVIVTATTGNRGGKAIPLRENVREGLAKASVSVDSIIVIDRQNGADVLAVHEYWYHELMSEAIPECEPAPHDAEDPLFILYTSGSTGKPKGVLHTMGGYLLYAAMTHEHVFDLEESDIFWCTADIGWVTGHSYVIYGPLANGATTVLFEGIPTWPTPSRFWEIIEKHKVTLFYTAPTALRSLMRLGDSAIQSCDRSSLRVLGTVGEPIDPSTWTWYHTIIGEGRCPIVDTWWQTETGGILLTPLANCTPLKPGSATLPFYGIKPHILTNEGERLNGHGSGVLVLEGSWPGQMRTVYKDHARFIETYFKSYPGYYATGDGAHRDEDGYYWITGRIDDVLNVSGHRLGTAEIEGELQPFPLEFLKPYSQSFGQTKGFPCERV